MSQKTPNRLIEAQSPYLLQHAYNPVDWYPWGEEALQKAQKEDKPIIVSIGYSACHWCHVMERESFENEDIAQIMNAHFICIKVDREERPDVDAIYMDAVQAMGQQGGWPLNAFLTPDAKPFFAGTYFPPQNWAQILQRIQQVFRKQRQELEESAEQLYQNLGQSDTQKFGLELPKNHHLSPNLDKLMYEGIAKRFDTKRGGINKAPKFPMPTLWEFVLHYAELQHDKEASAHLHFTLEKIALGGIYDQIGGGFARYSVDGEWFAPHFEKMLYDNGQLLSLYSHAYSQQANPLFAEVVQQTVDFMARELKSPEGGFYAALDADSEGVEGKFYTWTYQELQQIIAPEDFELFAKYYQIRPEGNWEEGVNILHRRQNDTDFAQTQELSLEQLKPQVGEWQEKLMEVRAQRVRPGLDDKLLCGWNALAITGLSEAYRVFAKPQFLSLAEQAAEFVQQHLYRPEGGLWRSYKKGEGRIVAYLEDYAALIEAFISLYEATFKQHYLKEAEQLTNYCLQNFYDDSEGFFFFTDQNGEQLIVRKKETFDNVIPASNSMMAKNLFKLGLMLYRPEWKEMAEKMLLKMETLLSKSADYLANWAQVWLLIQRGSKEVVIVGEKYLQYRQKVDQQYYPNKVTLGSIQENSELALLEGRSTIDGKTAIYICKDNACQLPQTNWESAIKQLIS